MTMSIQGPGRGSPPPNPFKKFDADGSKTLSGSELDAFASEMSSRSKDGKTVTKNDLLAKFDTNGDGAISESEMPKPPRGPRPGEGDSFDRGGGGRGNPFQFDTDGNGKLSYDELTQMAAQRSSETGESGPTADQMLAALDQDGDGEISASEMPPPPGPPPGEQDDLQDQVASQMSMARFRYM